MTIGSDIHRDDDRERGAVLVEFSLVFVLFVALLYGLISYGMAFAVKQSVTNAVSEAARSAVGDPVNPAGTAYTTAEDRLDWLGTSRCCSSDGTKPMDIQATSDPCGTRNCITVSGTYDYEDHPLVPALQLPGFGRLFPSVITSTATVQLPD